VQASALQHRLVAPTAPAVAALLVDECDRDVQGVSVPRTETHLVARFGPSARNGLDVHAIGARWSVHRKLIRSGQRTILARLHLGAAEAVLGASASTIAERIVSLDDLWGSVATRRLCERLAAARGAEDAARVLEGAIAERSKVAHERPARSQLVLDAAARLSHESVQSVAIELAVSERHLRRIFLETVGVSPKAFARLTRFHRALRAAREDGPASWASIATLAGYYDQAHLIAEFRAIAGVTPRVLVRELSAAPSFG
jgi:AraC-like DNA-binding protein